MEKKKVVPDWGPGQGKALGDFVIGLGHSLAVTRRYTGEYYR